MGSVRRRATVRRQRAAVICLLLFALSLWAPPAWTQTAPEEAKTGTALEAWYYVFDDGQEDPAPLPIVPDPVNPYGENTLHVGITAGQEESRTYISLDVGGLPTTFKLVEGTLVLPIAEENGTINAETSRAQVCLATMPTESVEGSFDEPPEVDCKTRAPAGYRNKPFPHLSVDLVPFGEDLAFSALAIMPSERAVEKQDTWHIGFYGKKNETEGAKPISATLSFVEQDFSIPEVAAPDTGTVGAPSGDFGSGSVSDVGDFGSAPSTNLGTDTAAPAAEVDQPAPAAAPAVTPQAQPAAALRPGYNVVWALPLVLLALYFYFGSALTREVVLRRRA